MATDNIRVLVVDDSAVIRAMIADYIGGVPNLTLAGVARNGVEAIECLAAICPDVVTLDLQMPDMDGLAVLDVILERHPCPVIMVSALTRSGAAVTLEALERGAVDYVAKPEHGVTTREAFLEELRVKVQDAAGIDVRRAVAQHVRPRLLANRPSAAAKADKASNSAAPAELAAFCVALGISTGGPPALTGLLEKLQPPLPPLVIVQHMPAQFTGPLAWRLNAVSTLTVQEARGDDVVRPNCVLIAPGGKHLTLRRCGSQVRTMIQDGPVVSGHRPSVDVMMTSAAQVFGAKCLGVIMTGMGRDGVQGCADIQAAGGFVLGQDEATSAVYGMNRAAHLAGHVNRQFALPEAANAIVRQLRRWGRSAATPELASCSARRSSSALRSHFDKRSLS